MLVMILIWYTILHNKDYDNYSIGDDHEYVHDDCDGNILQRQVR